MLTFGKKFIRIRSPLTDGQAGEFERTGVGSVLLRRNGPLAVRCG
jgi:hypothetical protein